MNETRQKEFLAEMRQVSRSYDDREIFRDCCRVFATCLRVPLLHNAEERNSAEERYQSIVAKYGKEGDSWQKRIELYLLDCGVTPDEIATFRSIMLEP